MSIAHDHRARARASQNTGLMHPNTGFNPQDDEVLVIFPIAMEKTDQSNLKEKRFSLVWLTVLGWGPT